MTDIEKENALSAIETEAAKVAAPKRGRPPKSESPKIESPIDLSTPKDMELKAAIAELDKRVGNLNKEQQLLEEIFEGMVKVDQRKILSMGPTLRKVRELKLLREKLSKERE